MKIKSKNVNMNLQDSIKNRLIDIEYACKLVQGLDYQMTITSAKDGKHMKNSKHYSGEAIDIRTSDMKFIGLVVNMIKKKLGKDFDVIFEVNHIHIEFDSKK